MKNHLQKKVDNSFENNTRIPKYEIPGISTGKYIYSQQRIRELEIAVGKKMNMKKLFD